MKKLLYLLLLISSYAIGQTQLELPYSIKVLNPKPLDGYYYNTSFTPYTNTAQVISQVASSVRYRGQVFNVAGVEYWFKDGVSDTDLIAKQVTESDPIVKSFVGIIKSDGATIGTVISGTDIKTINGSSILGSGDLVVSTPSWLLASGGTLTGPNIITGSTTNTISFSGVPFNITLPNATSQKFTAQLQSFSRGHFELGTGSSASQSYIDIKSGTGGTTGQITLDNTNILGTGAGLWVSDGAGIGLQYLIDYSNNFTSLSLISRKYADEHLKNLTFTNSPTSSGDIPTYNGTNWTFQQPTSISAWLLSSGGTLTGANTITGTSSNTLKYIFNSLDVTQTNGAGQWLANTTSAALNAQQISPSTVWEGQGWKTIATAGSQSVKFGAWVTPVQGLTLPSGTWDLYSSINGAAFGKRFSVSSTGAVAVTGSLSTNNGNTLLDNSGLTFNGFDPIISALGHNITMQDFNILQIGQGFGEVVNFNASSDGSVILFDDGLSQSGVWEFGGDAKFSITSFDAPSFSGETTQFNIQQGRITITDSKTSPTGLEYAASGYVTNPQSLADKEYVDTHSGVSSFNSRTGSVTAQSGDYNTSQVTENTNLYFTNARARSAVSFTTGSGAYNSSTGVFSIPTNTNELTNGAGFITASSSTTFTNKSGNISQWTNDSGYITASSSSTLTNKSGNISQWTNDSGYITASSSNTLTNKSGNISQWTNDANYITGQTWIDHNQSASNLTTTISQDGINTIVFSNTTGIISINTTSGTWDMWSSFDFNVPDDQQDQTGTITASYFGWDFATIILMSQSTHVYYKIEVSGSDNLGAGSNTREKFMKVYKL